MPRGAIYSARKQPKLTRAAFGTANAEEHLMLEPGCLKGTCVCPLQYRSPRKLAFEKSSQLAKLRLILYSRLIWTWAVENVVSARSCLNLRHSRRSFAALALPHVSASRVLLIEMQEVFWQEAASHLQTT